MILCRCVVHGTRKGSTPVTQGCRRCNTVLLQSMETPPQAQAVHCTSKEGQQREHKQLQWMYSMAQIPVHNTYAPRTLETG